VLLQGCSSRIALGLGDQATCYRSAIGRMRCAGRIYTTTYGPTFVDAGVSDVDQIFIGPTFDQANGNAICIHRTDGTAGCMGYTNSHGEFGNGVTVPSSTFVPWGDATNLVALATGTWDQFCAIDTEGSVSCSGYQFGTTPIPQGRTGGHLGFWVTTYGVVELDDMSTLRASESRTECRITEQGLTCPAQQPLGPPGHIVAGAGMSRVPGSTPGTCGGLALGGACWLTDAGDVECASCGSRRTFFEPGHVIALGVNFYGASLCAVYADGSLWCLGDNAQGMLGTGDSLPVQTATQVQPPGSVDVSCVGP
jgi:hypothetical protein